MKKITLCLITLIISSQSIAGVPFAFEAGTPAKASEVNQNFNSLDSAIDDLHGDLFTLNLFATGTSNDLSSLSSTVSTQGGNLSTLSTTVSGHTTSITSIQNSISAINTDLSSAETAIGTLESSASDLDTRVSTLEDATPASSDKCTPTERKSFYNDKIIYSYQSAAAGDLLSIGSGTDNYRIVKFPVEDVATGQAFIVTAPMRVYEGIVRMSVNIGSDVWGECAEDITVAGYPALIEMNEVLSYSFRTEQNEIFKEIYFDVLKIKLGGILLSYDINIWEIIEPLVLDLPTASYDLTGLDLSGYATDNSYFNTVNEIISYIKIEEVTP